MTKEKLVAVVGPTAVGKTKVSIELAKAFGGEVINGDSMQVYKGMDIGTAKITEKETEGIPHHLFDIKDPTESYSAAEFQKRARALVSQINQRGRTPIVVGGTGMYIKSLTHDFNFSETDSDIDFRREVEKYYRNYGGEALYRKLQAIDPESTKQIHPHNVRRVIRALEIYQVTGVPASQRRKQESESPYRLALVGLSMDRETLYQRINKRVDQMMENGLLEEVRHLYNRGIRDCQSFQAIGYKEMISYFQGECTLEEAIEWLKRNSRRYAKRQYTWFRRQMDVHWFEMKPGESGKKISAIKQFVAGTL